MRKPSCDSPCCEWRPFAQTILAACRNIPWTRPTKQDINKHRKPQKNDRETASVDGRLLHHRNVGCDLLRNHDRLRGELLLLMAVFPLGQARDLVEVVRREQCRVLVDAFF